MSFIADILIGAAPFMVEFTDTTPDSVTHGSVIGWSWDFDDGATSLEQNPTHTYIESGRYSPELTVIYEDLETEVFTNIDYIIVDVANLEADIKCLRFATEQSEGYGWSELTGNNIVEPFDNYGANQVIDDNGNSRDIVFDKNDYMLYEVDTCDKIIYTRPSPLDKNIDEISGEKWEKETTFDQITEHKDIQHELSHVYIQPKDEMFRGTSGYSETGQRSAQKIDIEAYLGGEKLEYSGKARSIIENGEVFFHGIPLRNNKVQLVVKLSAGEIRVTGHSHEFLGIEGSPAVQKREQSEYQTLKELSKELLLHIVRNVYPGYNRVSRSVLNGFIAIEGPDGKNSAISSADQIALDNYEHSGEASVIIWARSAPVFPYLSLSQYGTTGKNGWFMFYGRTVSILIPASTWILEPDDYYDIRIYKKYLTDNALILLFEDITMFNGIKTIPIK